jgi:TonB family protein
MMFERVYGPRQRSKTILSGSTIVSISLHIAAVVAMIGTGIGPAHVAQQISEGIIFLAPLPSRAAGPTGGTERITFLSAGAAPAEITADVNDIFATTIASGGTDAASAELVAGEVEDYTGAFEQEADSVYLSDQVDSPVAYDARSGAPVYPDTLQRARVEGAVVAHFVVDTLGRVELETFVVVASTDRLFTESVREALPRMLFRPAEIGGVKARQLVELPFQFRIITSSETTKRDTTSVRGPG